MRTSMRGGVRSIELRAVNFLNLIINFSVNLLLWTNFRREACLCTRFRRNISTVSICRPKTNPNGNTSDGQTGRHV